MKLLKFLPIIAALLLCSCYNETKLKGKAEHQSQAGDRINKAKQNTDDLFKELDE